MGRWTRQIVSGLMLVAMAGLPVMATTCAALCEPDVVGHANHAATVTTEADALAASMHHDMAGCHPASTSDLRLTSARPHDCGTHDGARREAETTLTTARIDAWAPVTITLPALAPSAANIAGPLGTPSGTSPPLVFSSTTLPLVLRV